MDIWCNGGKNQPLPAEQRPIIALLNYRKEKKRKKRRKKMQIFQSLPVTGYL